MFLIQQQLYYEEENQSNLRIVEFYKKKFFQIWKQIFVKSRHFFHQICQIIQTNRKKNMTTLFWQNWKNEFHLQTFQRQKILKFLTKWIDFAINKQETFETVLICQNHHRQYVIKKYFRNLKLRLRKLRFLRNRQNQLSRNCKLHLIWKCFLQWKQLFIIQLKWKLKIEMIKMKHESSLLNHLFHHWKKLTQEKSFTLQTIQQYSQSEISKLSDSDDFLPTFQYKLRLFSRFLMKKSLRKLFIFSKKKRFSRQNFLLIQRQKNFRLKEKYFLRIHNSFFKKVRTIVSYIVFV
jgi:hypothetical protein